METRQLEISWASLWRVLFFLIFVLVLFIGRQILLGLFLAIVISSGVDVAVDFLERRGLPRTLGVILVFLAALLAVVLLVYLVAPLVIADLRELLFGTDGSKFGSPAFFKASKSIEDVVAKLSSVFFENNLSPLDFFSKVLGGAGLAVGVLVSSFYLSLSRSGVEKFLRFVLPGDYERAALAIYERSRRKITFWLQTQIFTSLVMCVSVWIALALLGVKHAFLLGIFAGVFEVMPFVGPILAGAVAVLVAYTTSLWLAVWTFVAFVGLHQFESHVLIPLLTKRSVGLHPVIVITALLIGAEAGGLLGIVVSVPAAAVFHEALEEWSSRRKAAPAPL